MPETRSPATSSPTPSHAGHVEMPTGQIILLTRQMAATDLDLSMPRKRWPARYKMAYGRERKLLRALPPSTTPEPHL